MHADLVRAAAQQAQLQQAVFDAIVHKGFTGLDQRLRRLAALVDEHPALAVGHGFPLQGQLDPADSRVPAPVHDGFVGLDHVAALQLALQLEQGLAVKGEQQAAAGIPVQPVHQLDLAVRTQDAQGVDGPETQTRARVHRQPRRLVEHQQVRVLVENASGKLVEQALRDRGRRRRLLEAKRRNAQQVALAQAVLGLDPLLVDPYLALANDPVEPALRQVLQGFRQVVVESLPRLLRADLDQPHGAGARRRLGG